MWARGTVEGRRPHSVESRRRWYRIKFGRRPNSFRHPGIVWNDWKLIKETWSIFSTRRKGYRP